MPSDDRRRAREKLRGWGSEMMGARFAIAALSIAAVVLGAPLILADERAPNAPAADDSLAELRAEFVAALRRVQAGPEGAEANFADGTDGSNVADGTGITDGAVSADGGNDAAGSGSTAASDDLRAYPLYSYLEAARLVRALGTATGPDAAADAASRAFLARHGEEPVAREVRRARIESFARRGLWQAFLAEADPDPDDQALRCIRLRARIALDDVEDIAPEIIDAWLTGRRLPIDCEPVFQWLHGEGLLTDELVEGRVRLLLENGQAAFARVIADRLPADRAAPWLRWADLIEQPRATFDRLLAAPDTSLPVGALYDGWQRLSRNRPGDAFERFPALLATFGLDAAEASRATLALALGLAWDRRPEALEVFARVAPEHLDDYALGWLARAALWAGDFRLAGDAITAMSPAQRDETRWRYWAGRAAEETGERRRARELYRSVLTTDNYYAAMAAARLGEPAVPEQAAVPLDERRVERIAALAPFVRARELLRVRMPSEAAAEWRYGSTSLDPEDGLQTIHLAMRWGWYDIGVATATSHRIFYDYGLLYPKPYDEAVADAASLAGLDPALLYGLIRQESLYRADAASAAGALGLAQLRPETARRVARQLNRPTPSRADLLVPEINLILGAAELRALLDEFEGQLPVALAGYNAGPNAARRWLPERPLDADVWIENIPYNETRDYVQRVLWHNVVFSWLETGDGRDTSGWLAAIEPVADDRELRAER